MKGGQDIGNKLLWIKQNYTEDEFMININLIEAISQTIVYFDLEQQWLDRNNGNISKNWKQSDINKIYVPMKMHLWQKQIDKIIYSNNDGDLLLAKERQYASYIKIKNCGTKLYQSNELSLKLNVCEFTSWQKNEQ